MIATTEKIEYGKEIIEFELLQENRKTLSIEVLPTTKIKVKAPESKNKQDIIKKVHVFIVDLEMVVMIVVGVKMLKRIMI